ncbi:MAG: hypothetical protein ACJAZO_000768 [Myxococcota bacterium]|jgi:hypothetical protein
MDGVGTPVTDSMSLIPAIHDDVVPGALVDAEWSDTLSVDVHDGYYSVVLRPVDNTV